MNEAAAALWRFSLAFYARADIAAACLALQDDHGRDVNIILYACWIGLSGRGRLDSAALQAAEERFAPWRRAVTEHLRAARRALKTATTPDAQALHAAVKALELEAERLGQEALAALAPARVASILPETAAADAGANLALYLSTPEAHAAAAPIFAALPAFAADQPLGAGSPQRRS